MHDIDRVRLESDTAFEQWNEGGFGQAEYEPFQFESFEYADSEAAVFDETDSVFSEADEIDLASELLSVGRDQELDQFLGKVIRRAGQAVGRAIRSPAGQAIGGILKGAARQALPHLVSGLGSGIGGHFGGQRGAQFGGQVAAATGKLFGLELEGLSGEDQEFEIGRRFIRFAGAAVRNLAKMPPRRDLLAAARAAAIAAAQRYAPGLLRAQVEPEADSEFATGLPVTAGRSQSGRWLRRGNRIVVLGL
jgi:hypothetical protein